MNKLYTKAQILVTLRMRLHFKNSFKQSPFHPSLTFSRKQVFWQLTADTDEYKQYRSNLLDCPTEWSYWERKVYRYTSNYFHPSKHKLRLHVAIFASRFSLSRLGIRRRCVYTRGIIKLACV